MRRRVGHVKGTARWRPRLPEREWPTDIFCVLHPPTAEAQALAMEELARLGPPGPRERVHPGCSAVQLMMDDYGDLMVRIPAVRGVK